MEGDGKPGSLEHLRDKNGRLPGEAGYYGVERNPPKDFATYQKELKEKKAAEEAAKKAAE